MKQYNVGLLEPVFDNLYLMLRRRGAKITSVQENDLIDLDALEAKIKKDNLKSVFIVTPNNPTGFQLDADEFRGLCNLCARTGVALIIDKTFRLYSKKDFDDYKILNESGTDYVVIEDTGKTWPTQDAKVSLMVYSESLAKDLRMLYEEIYLCSSNFTLAFLKTVMEKTKSVGIDRVIHQEVTKRMHHVENALSATPLVLMKSDRACSLPLAWIDCSATGVSDLELVQKLKEHQVALLPGRFFFWNSQDQHTSNVRLSLMKPDGVFYRGLDVLSEAIRKISKSEPLTENNERPAFLQKIEGTSRDPG
jgi:aspartate/methionine/tyrosine aminotransferase